MDDEELARQLRAWSSGPSPAPSVAAWRREAEADGQTATALLDEPRDGASTATELGPAAPDPRRHRWVARAAIVVLVVAVAGAAWVAVDRAREPSVASSPDAESLAPLEEPLPLLEEFHAGPCATGPMRPTDPDVLRRYMERAEQLRLESEEARRTGFQKMSGPDANGEGDVCGWTKVADDGSGLPVFVPGGGNPLYDGIDGNLMGYLYPYVGFVTVEEASAPGFDPVALRLDENGCDPLTTDC